MLSVQRWVALRQYRKYFEFRNVTSLSSTIKPTVVIVSQKVMWLEYVIHFSESSSSLTTDRCIRLPSRVFMFYSHLFIPYLLSNCILLKTLVFVLLQEIIYNFIDILTYLHNRASIELSFGWYVQPIRTKLLFAKEIFYMFWCNKNLWLSVCNIHKLISWCSYWEDKQLINVYVRTEYFFGG